MQQARRGCRCARVGGCAGMWWSGGARWGHHSAAAFDLRGQEMQTAHQRSQITRW